jgi:hypothetical protein
VTTLSAKVAELHRLGEMQTQSLAGKLARRDELLDDMVRTTLEIAGVVLTVASEQKLTAIAPDVRLFPGDFARLRKEKRPWLARRVLEAARTVMPQLAPYGVTEETLAAFEAKIEATLEGLHQPRSTSAEKQSATRLLPALFAEVDTLLADSIDRLVLPLLNSSPRFFEAYKVARTIVDRRGSRRGETETSAPPAPSQVTASITPTEEKTAA